MPLHVHLFGAIELVEADQPLPHLATAKAEALLAYLLVEEALRPGASHRREGLMALLWPDMPLESAQLNLRQTLYRLRQGLPDGATLVAQRPASGADQPGRGLWLRRGRVSGAAEPGGTAAAASTWKRWPRRPRFTATTCWPASSCPTARVSRRGRRRSDSVFAARPRTR